MPEDNQAKASPGFRKIKIIVGIVAVILLALSAVAWENRHEIVWYIKRLPYINRFFKPSVEGHVANYGAAARARLGPKFAANQVPYPPEKIVFIAIKATKQLEIYSAGVDGIYKYVCTYPIYGASGHLGPKLREGDCQVPEGIYSLSFEPNTPYHVALRLNYPNESDLARARADGRDKPGSDILIHGTTGSVGCIAMGDEASEDLFVLAYDTRDHHFPLIVAPVDLRVQPPPPALSTDPTWLPDLYNEIKAAMTPFRRTQ